MATKSEEQYEHSRPAYVVLLAAVLARLLTLILMSPLNYLLPVLPFTSYQRPCASASSWAHPDRTHTRVFQPDNSLERTSYKSTPPHDQLSWEDLLVPENGGGILAQRPPPPADPTDIENEDTNVTISYGISMFHQLHCLIILRGLIFPETSHKRVNSSLLPHSKHAEMDRTYWAHCFDYIAQAIICAADDTIEQPRKTIIDGRTVYNVHGVGAQHQCRDSRRLWEISMDSLDERVNMRVWENGVGAREFFKHEDGRKVYELPEVYTKGM